MRVDTPPIAKSSASDVVQGVPPPVRVKAHAKPVARVPPMKGSVTAEPDAPVTTSKAGGAARAAPPVGDRRKGSVHIVGGDLMNASEQYIVHQCSCTISGKAGGVAATVFNRFPDVDVYKLRQQSWPSG